TSHTESARVKGVKTAVKSVRRVRGRLHQLHQDTAGVLRVHEVDARVGRAALGGVVEQTYAALAQDGAHGVDVGDPVGELLQARAGAGEELGDGRLVVEGSEQLDERSRLADRDHGLPDALLLVGLAVRDLHAEDVAVERDRLVQVRYGDTDVVDGGEEVGGDLQRCVHGYMFSPPRPAPTR